MQKKRKSETEEKQIKEGRDKIKIKNLDADTKMQ